MRNSFLFSAIERGEHTHVKVRTGPAGCARGYNGMLMFRTEEWTELFGALVILQSRGLLAIELDTSPETFDAIPGEEP